MLSHLAISHFAIVDHLELEFRSGLTVITGETGAGKSISLDALALTLGERADAGCVFAGAKRADITATFDIQGLPQAQQWLQGRDLNQGHECLLRRVITREGRSRAYINGQPVTLTDLRDLGALLIEIHGQHAHQALLQREHHRHLLDQALDQPALTEQVRTLAREWRQTRQRWQRLNEQRDQHEAQLQLLNYQLQELEQLALGEQELEELEEEHRRLASAEQVMRTTQQLITLISEMEPHALQDGLRQAEGLASEIADMHQATRNAHELLTSCTIQLEEALLELRHFSDGFEADPERLQQVEERLDQIYQVARKHRLAPDQLPQLYAQLQEQLAALTTDEQDLDHLHAHCQRLHQHYLEAAQQLSQARRTMAEQLTAQVEAQLAELAMPHCRIAFEFTALNPEIPTPAGLEEVELKVATNAGQSLRPIAKVASGGELSRLSLALMVVTQAQTPTLIFDEVDSGIGGAVAEVVGNLLKRLAQQGQVLCVTHLPQVASKGEQHFKVGKQTRENVTTTEVSQLDEPEKVEEIARMLGGLTITDQSLAHAREMLNSPLSLH